MNVSNKLEDCKKEIRSILIAYQRGCLLSEFNRAYHELIGRRLPFREFFFRSDIEFLCSLTNVVKVSLTRFGEYHLEGVADEKSVHIQKMVAKQKPTKLKSSARLHKPLKSFLLPPRFSEPVSRHFEPVSRNHFSNQFQQKTPENRALLREPSNLPSNTVSNKPKEFTTAFSREEPKLHPESSAKEEIKLFPKSSPKEEVIALVQHFNNEMAIDDLLFAYKRMYQKELLLSKYGYFSIEECIEDIPELCIKNKNKCTFVVYESESSDASDTNENCYDQSNSGLSIDRKDNQNHVAPEYNNSQNDGKALIADSLRKKLQMVAERFTQGIWSHEFLSRFEETTGTDLDLSSLRYQCLSDLIDAVSDIFVREPVVGSRKGYIIYPANKFRPELTEPSSLSVSHVIVNIRKILQAIPEGIQMENFMHVYSINCKDTLCIKDLGFDDLETFLTCIESRVPLRIDSSKGVKTICMVWHNNSSSYIEGQEIFPSQPIPFDVVCPEFKFKIQTLSAELNDSEYFAVYMSSVANPSHLYIQVQGEETTDALVKLAGDIENFYNGNMSDHYIMKSTHIKIGTSCIAKWPSDEHWYRAEIMSVTSPETVLVHYVDYGTKDTIHNNLLRYMKKEFADLPAQAIRCQLAFLKPAKNAIKWDIQSRNRILNLCEDVPLMAKIEEITLDGIYSIILCDTNGQEDVYINDVLHTEGLADHIGNTYVQCEPPVPVEKHHNLSPLEALQAQYFLQAFVTVAPSFAQNENFINLFRQVSTYCTNPDPGRQNVSTSFTAGPPGFNKQQSNMYAYPNVLTNAFHNLPTSDTKSDAAYHNLTISNAKSDAAYHNLPISNAKSDAAYHNLPAPYAKSEINHKFNILSSPVHVANSWTSTTTDFETSTSLKEAELSPEDEFVEAESEIFDDDDDETFQQFCMEMRWKGRTSDTPKRRYVKRLLLGDGYKIHVIVNKSTPYASCGDICQLIWNNKGADYLFKRLQMNSDIPVLSLCEDGNEELFRQLQQFNVRGIQKTTGSKTSILLYPLKEVINILNIFGHPSVSVRTKLTDEIASFNSNDANWMNISSHEPLELEEEESFSGVTDDDKIEKLCLFDLLTMKDSITLKRKMLKNNMSKVQGDEINKLNQLYQKVLQRIQEIREICNMFA